MTNNTDLSLTSDPPLPFHSSRWELLSSKLVTLHPREREKNLSAAMTTSRCTLLPEVLPDQSRSAHTGRLLSDVVDSGPMCALDFSAEPALLGKATEEPGAPTSGQPQYYTQVSTKLDSQLLSPVVGAYAKQWYVWME